MTDGYLLLQFADASQVEAAARQVSGAGCKDWDVFAPYPLPALQPLLKPALKHTNWAAWGGAAGGALLALGLQVGGAYAYPIDVGGRPLLAVPMLPVLMLLLAILFAAFAVVLSLLVQCRLPRLHHPLFDHPAFAQVSDHAFFICIALQDPRLSERLRASLSERASLVDEVRP